MFPSKNLVASCTWIWIWVLLVFPCLVGASFSKPDTMFTAVNAQKPGCKPKCGNITIPYPFGIGRDCAMSDDYVVNCTNIRGHIYALYVDNNTAILDMSETELTLTSSAAARSCNSEGKETTANNWGEIHVLGKPYALSSTANTFMVVGCHHYGLLRATTKTDRRVVSCVALCTEEADLYDDSCSGIGCCEAPLPKGLQDFQAGLEKIVYSTNVTSGNCSYSFLAKRSSIDFRRAIDLQDPGFDKKVQILPSVMDWFIANATCKEAQKNVASFACQRNTSCIDLEQDLNVYGYRCKCLQGFEGNPYLSPGCTDIDECRGPSNPCSHSCTNIPGSYQCNCPSGFNGDGKKNGTGCFPKSLKLALPLGLGIGLGTVLFSLGVYWFFVMAKRRKEILQRANNFKRNGGLLLQQQMSSTEGMIERTRIFTNDELDKATDHFNENRVLGQGGQGTVYKGMLSDGNIVAIKKSKKVGHSHVGEFINEVVILSQINHRNIVKLLGCCLETEIPLLVYEYVPNGTLSRLIHDPSEDFPITWEMRLQIAIDVAGALNYLHSSSSNPIFHRDIKTSNILLDAKYRAKLSDFGTSRSIAVDQTHLTTRVQGTFGYLDPEYFRSHQFTDKSDVYGFGVVLVELLTGLRAILPSQAYDGKSLASWFLSAMENFNLDDILATRVAKEGSQEAILAVANLAKRSLNMDGKNRPTMREVFVELEMISQQHHLLASNQKKTPEVNEQTSRDITFSPSESLLRPYTDEDYSLPSNWSTASQIQDHSMETFFRRQ
ncbi:wall-associated receptor kinase-like 6 [Silene latifolia]|uniref:wall-associated receptor kinase-like 6 n=1 Tax=Silene latifolia TaxID=37657 RepID=UPI003D7737BD